MKATILIEIEVVGLTVEQDRALGSYLMNAAMGADSVMVDAGKKFLRKEFKDEDPNVLSTCKVKIER